MSDKPSNHRAKRYKVHGTYIDSHTQALVDMVMAEDYDRLIAPLVLFVRQWNACGPNSDFGRYFQDVRDAAVKVVGDNPHD
ncbi:MAG TPA: hypothetical protein VMS08_00970 [Candidatus Saccharimonadia bacterium]|nr:hypothetical protein [Candidatus Saccharimonadia bacterium]